MDEHWVRCVYCGTRLYLCGCEDENHQGVCTLCINEEDESFSEDDSSY